MKLRQRPHKSPIGVKFKFSDEYSLPFHIGAPPSPRISKCLTGSEGVMEWNRPTTTTWKIKFSKLKMGKICKWDDSWRHTLNPSLDQAYKWGYLGQFAVQNIKTWQADSSTGNTPMAINNSVPVSTHSFPAPTHLISICKWFSAWKMLNKATNTS